MEPSIAFMNILKLFKASKHPSPGSDEFKLYKSDIDNEMLLKFAFSCIEEPIKHLIEHPLHNDTFTSILNWLSGPGQNPQHILLFVGFRCREMSKLCQTVAAMATLEYMASHNIVINGTWKLIVRIVFNYISHYEPGMGGHTFICPNLRTWLLRILGAEELCPDLYLRFEMMNIVSLLEYDYHPTNWEQILEGIVSVISRIKVDILLFNPEHDVITNIVNMNYIFYKIYACKKLQFIGERILSQLEINSYSKEVNFLINIIDLVAKLSQAINRKIRNTDLGSSPLCEYSRDNITRSIVFLMTAISHIFHDGIGKLQAVCQHPKLKQAMTSAVYIITNEIMNLEAMICAHMRPNIAFNYRECFVRKTVRLRDKLVQMFGIFLNENSLSSQIRLMEQGQYGNTLARNIQVGSCMINRIGYYKVNDYAKNENMYHLGLDENIRQYLFMLNGNLYYLDNQEESNSQDRNRDEIEIILIDVPDSGEINNSNKEKPLLEKKTSLYYVKSDKIDNVHGRCIGRYIDDSRCYYACVEK